MKNYYHSAIICTCVFVLTSCVSSTGSRGISDEVEKITLSEWEQIGPDGHQYPSSRAVLPDIFGPTVTMSVNKPVDVPELPEDTALAFIHQIATDICAKIDKRPTAEHVISVSEANPGISRYKHQGIDRVAYRYTFHCVK